MSFCPNCGNKLDSDVNFCPKCGAKLSKSVIDTLENQEYYSEAYIPERGIAEKFFKISGRLNPSRYILRLTVLLIIFGTIYPLLYFSSGFTEIAIIIPFLSGMLAIPLHIRRAHDLGHSGWYIIIAFIPILAGIGEFLTRKVYWRDRWGKTHMIKKFNETGFLPAIAYLMIASIFSGLYFVFKSGTRGENEYGADPNGEIADIPFEENPILATISKMEEHKNSAWITAGTFIVSGLLVSTLMILIAKSNIDSYYVQNNPDVSLTEDFSKSSNPQKFETVEKQTPKESHIESQISKPEEPIFAQTLTNDSQKAAANVLISFHKNITDRNFSQAYNCLSQDFQYYMSYDGWVPGFNTTVSSSVNKIRVYSEYQNEIVLTYVLTAVDNIDGRIQTTQFNGEATLINEGGFWKIDKIINRNK